MHIDPNFNFQKIDIESYFADIPKTDPIDKFTITENGKFLIYKDEYKLKISDIEDIICQKNNYGVIRYTLIFKNKTKHNLIVLDTPKCIIFSDVFEKLKYKLK